MKSSFFSRQGWQIAIVHGDGGHHPRRLRRHCAAILRTIAAALNTSGPSARPTGAARTQCHLQHLRRPDPLLGRVIVDDLFGGCAGPGGCRLVHGGHRHAYLAAGTDPPICRGHIGVPQPGRPVARCWHQTPDGRAERFLRRYIDAIQLFAETRSTRFGPASTRIWWLTVGSPGNRQSRSPTWRCGRRFWPVARFIGGDTCPLKRTACNVVCRCECVSLRGITAVNCGSRGQRLGRNSVRSWSTSPRACAWLASAIETACTMRAAGAT